MTSQSPAEKAVPRSSQALLGLIAALLAFQIWIITQWIAAVSAANNQPDRVQHYLAHLPFGLGRYGATNVTWLTVVLGLVSLAAAMIASRKLQDTGRAIGVALAVVNGILVLWYLFTLM